MAAEPPASQCGAPGATAATLANGTGSDDGSTPLIAAVPALPYDVMLVFSHECAHAACDDHTCNLCCRASRRRCGRPFKHAYAVGDAVVAACGAPLHVELVLARSHVPVRHPPPGTHIQLYLVQDDAYESAMRLECGVEPLGAGGGAPRFPKVLAGHNRDLDGAYSAGERVNGRRGVMPAVDGAGDGAVRAIERVGHGGERASDVLNKFNTAVIAAGDNGDLSDADRVSLARLVAAAHAAHPLRPLLTPDVVRFDNRLATTAACIGYVKFRVPSERTALLAHGGGDGCAAAGPSTAPQSPPRSRQRAVRLVAALVHDDDAGTPYPNATPAVSDAFVVHLQRPRQVKAAVALTTDAVGVLPHVGANSVNRLADVVQAASRVGVVLPVPTGVGRVRTVADLQALVAAADANEVLDLGVRTTLMLTSAQWQEVKQATRRALEPDSRLRVWYNGDRMRGLVFTCHEGEINLDRPVARLAAIVSWDPPPGTRTLPCPDTDVAVIIGHTLDVYEESVDRAEADALRDVAVADWCEAGHVGWGILSAGGCAIDGPDAVARLATHVRGNRVAGVYVLEVQEVGG